MSSERQQSESEKGLPGGSARDPGVVLRRTEYRPPLYEDSCFTFRFADDRIIPRFHLEGVTVGSRVAVFKIDPRSGERLEILATSIVVNGGWVDLREPILVKAGDGFIAVPERDRSAPR